MADTIPKAVAPGAMAHDKAATLEASRRELGELAVLLALPAMWVDQPPAVIATGLLDVLFGVLRLESGYVQFDDPSGGPALKRWRPTGSHMPIELERALAFGPAREHGPITVSIPTPSGDGTFRVASICPAFPGEGGLVLVGSRRSDFPTAFELHHLRVAVGQAAISIHTARRLASERAARIAAESALRRRNAFLASVVEELKIPLAALAERAAQAHALATESDQSLSFDELADSSVEASGESWLHDSAVSLAPTPRLSPREGEVLGLLAQGLSNKEIAGILWLSDRTVERHITGLYRKIGVHRRSEATAYALRHGFVAIDAPEE